MKAIFAVFATVLAILAWNHPAAAQQAGKAYRVGYLFAGSAHTARAWVVSLRQGLRELGYVDVVVVERYAAGRRERLPALAAELVGLDVDVIVTHGGSLDADRAAKKAGKTIPVVFAVSADPIGAGYVVSLARPGGNITGLSDLHSDLVPKRLKLLKDVVPSATRVAVFWSPNARHTQSQLKALQAMAPSVGVTLLPIVFAKPGDLERAFETLRRERPDALNVLGYPVAGGHQREIAKFALENGLPTLFTLDSFPVTGGLMSYGTRFPDMYRRAATLVDKILKGAKPADLPVEQPTRFYLTVNLKTAKALGITFPRSILLRADKVIE